jgi:putative phage-type endonuclease
MDEPESLDQQQELRERQLTGLGSTDTPKILGISRYGTPLTVWSSKVERSTSEGTSLPAWLGLQLQSTVAELYRVATGHRVRAANRHYRHKQDEWLVCHLDYRLHGDPNTIVECKTRAYMRGWGEDGSTQIPPDVWAQVQHQMLVTGATLTHVAVLFGHHTFRVYPIPRDDLFLTALRESLRAFWHDHVLTGVPPEPTGSSADARYLGKAHPQDDGDMLTATPSQALLVKTLAEAMQEFRVRERLVSEAENKIKAALGEHEGFYSPYGSVKWKTTKERNYTDWEAAANEAGVLLEIVQKHTKVKPGVRRFSYFTAEES